MSDWSSDVCSPALRPRDGVTTGDLLVRGQWVVDRYIRHDNDPLQDGWFPTGDVAHLDGDGFLQITDRSKDVIKSGGEWISSIELENIAMAHPAIAEVAVIGVKHPKWDERPVIVAEIGRAHVGTPVNNAPLICRLMLEKKKRQTT